MARTSYHAPVARAYRVARQVPLPGLREWRLAIERYASPGPDTTIVDVGAGTGWFAAAFVEWFGVRVLAVEPSADMRAVIPVHPSITVLNGDAGTMPVTDGSADAGWLSTVVHHIPDLAAAARELRRVLRPGAPVLIRQAFPERADRLTMVRYFPETRRVLDSYPTVAQVRRAFATAGFARVALAPVSQQTAESLGGYADRLGHARQADTLLRGLTDDEFAAGRERVRAAVREAPDQPVVDQLDLLVLR
jgi:ubiquinone/menaquinone biosynthesis C-methylase UbiE